MVPGKYSLIFLLQVLFSSIVFAEEYADSETRYYFLGTIGDDLPIQIELVIDSEDVSGIYYYEKNGIPLSLSGEISYSDSTISLSEKDVEGNEAGTFNGKVIVSPGNFAETVEGKWSSGDGDKSLPFKLRKVAEYVILTTNQAMAIQASTVYPFFLTNSKPIKETTKMLQLGLVEQHNHFIEEAQEFFQSGKTFGGWERKSEYSIEYYSDELISLAGTIYSYTGGAHGNTEYVSSNFFVKSGKATPIKFADLFEPNSVYLKRVSDYIVKQLREQKAEGILNGEIQSFKEEDLSIFAISPRGLQFAFAPYRVGPYSQGSFFVTIPYNELKNILNPKGPIKRFIESN